MIRLVGILIGLGFSLVVLIAFGTGLATVISEGQLKPKTAEHEFHLAPKPLTLASDGLFGNWDKAQLQRGYQVYKEVCSACHSLKFVHFRDLKALGYNDAQVKALAATWNVPSKDPATGEVGTRPGLPTDAFPPVYYSGQGHPPDLSLITKARHGGAAYVHSLVTGYADVPAELTKEFPDFAVPPGAYYNPYFANLNIAMPPPLADGQVTFADGSPNTADAMATDVAAFLTWTAEPKLVERKRTGWPVLGFLLFATILAYFAKQNVWADAKRKKQPA